MITISGKKLKILHNVHIMFQYGFLYSPSLFSVCFLPSCFVCLWFGWGFVCLFSSFGLFFVFLEREKQSSHSNTDERQTCSWDIRDPF